MNDSPLARSRAEVLDALRARIPGYTPGWAPRDGSAGFALAQIWARYVEIFSQGLDRVPDRSLLAFLDTLGTHLLPAQPARAPLVFELMDNSPVDVTLPRDSQVAAPVQPPPPSPLLEAEAQATEAEPVLFATTQAISLTRARLAALYSLLPASDEYADHSAQLASGFTVFDDAQLVEHAIYLGHDELFALAGEADVNLSFSLGAAALPADGHALQIEWEYLSKDGWLALELEDDRTAGLAQGGQVLLRKRCGPDAKEEAISGHSSYWLRGRLQTPLLPQSAAGMGAVPVLDTVRARVGFTKSGLPPEAAFTDAFRVDTGNNFYPFGRQPATYTTFYLASKEVFQRRGARIGIEFELSGVGAGSAVLAWEYSNGTNWLPLAREFQDGTAGLTQTSGTVSFLCPLDWRESEVNGEKNYWLRARIDQGDYGHPTRVRAVADPPGSSTFKVVAEDSTLQPPVVARLSLRYTYQTEAVAPDHCLTFNDFVSSDQSEACRWPRRPFEPFRPVADQQPALYFGFDRRLPTGLVSLYLHLPPEAALEGAARRASPFVWEYRSARGWSELGVLDETQGFRASGLIQWVGPADALSEPGLGGKLYRIRARLKQGERLEPAPVAGVWLNAVWGTQRQVLEQDVLGTSDGNPGQTFSFLRRRGPVLEGEKVEVREWRGRGDDWETAVQDVPPSDLRFETDPVDGVATAVWVRWHPRPHLFGSGSGDRHYVVERSTGMLRFGDGQHGLVPPAGARIVASYNSGGGLAGNVPAGAVSELRTGVPYLKGVSNPVASGGGADTEGLDAVRERGPQRLRHRDRAVSAADFEWLAREASPGVARARCLPLAGPDGFAQRGWVTVVVIPHSREASPQPTPELVRQVREHLAARVPAAVARRVRVLGAAYLPVSVVAEIAPRRPGEAAQVEARLRERLNLFLHPLHGGPEGRGWAFGQALHLSQVARLVEETPGVDYALHIGLRADGRRFDELLPVGAEALIAAGDHEIKVTIGKD